MILARKKSGWLIAVDAVRETEMANYVKTRDTKKEIRVGKNDEDQKIFTNTDDAIDWIDS